MFYPPITTSPGQQDDARTAPLPTSNRAEKQIRSLPDFIESGASLPEVVTKPPKRREKRKYVKQLIDLNKLPESVLECIFQQLKIIHLDRRSSSCNTCYMRDLVALQRVNRRWSKSATRWLYTDIEIVGADAVAQTNKYKSGIGTRIRLLRRTLRASLSLSHLVKCLHVPDPDIPLYLQDGQRNSAFDHYRDLVASLVMSCPNLERLLGFYCWYSHEYDRLTHALSLRRHLRSHVWIISENDEITTRSETQLPPGIMSPCQVDQFLSYNSWSKLEDLYMCSPGGAGVVEHHVFIKILRRLPSLRRLCVSNFDVDDFTDATLLNLPPLECLRLEECLGVTDKGLSRWAATPATDHIQKLALIHQNICSLLTISKMLSSMSRLVRFTIVQSDIAPVLPDHELVFQPIFASSSLKSLHWDIDDCVLSEDDESSTPNAHLAMSIKHDGFPLLRWLRAPRDIFPPGALQAVCKPASQGRVLRPADKYIGPPATSGASKPASENMPARGNSLRSARIRAQCLIDDRYKASQEFMRVVVTDHSQQENVDDERDSATSLSYSRTSTDATDPDDLWSPVESKASDVDFDFEQSTTSEDISKCFPDRLSAVREEDEGVAESLSSKRSSPRPRPALPLTVSEFKVPAFVGRMASVSGRPPPRFNLAPDVEGFDANGGLIGWGDLLRVNEKSEPRSEDGKRFMRDSCIGAWNKGRGKPPELWKHTERPRRRLGRTLELDHFF